MFDTKEQSVRANKFLENVCQRKYTPLYEKGIKQNQNKQMETTMQDKDITSKKYKFCLIYLLTSDMCWKSKSAVLLRDGMAGEG